MIEKSTYVTRATVSRIQVAATKVSATITRICLRHLNQRRNYALQVAQRLEIESRHRRTGNKGSALRVDGVGVWSKQRRLALLLGLRRGSALRHGVTIVPVVVVVAAAPAV